MSAAEFYDDNGTLRLGGTLVGGGGMTGDGSPVGVVTPDSLGQQYTDTTNGALWLAVGATDADWVVVSGNIVAAAVGVYVQAATSALIGGPNANPGQVKVVDSGGTELDAGNDSGTGSGGSIEVASGVGVDGGNIFVQGGGGDVDTGTGGGVFLTPGPGDTPGELGFFDGGAAQQTVTGALSTVADAPAKAVLTSIIAALAAYGLAVDGTT